MNTAPEIVFPNLGIEIEHLSRTAFSVFGFDIYWYGVFIGLAVVIGILIIFYNANRTGQNPDMYFDFSMLVMIVSLIGARLYYVIFSWDMYKRNLLEIFNFRNGGLAIYGGVIAATIMAVLYSRKKGISLWLLTDTCVPSLALGQAIGRWGNFFNREAFGTFTDSFFAMRYTLDTVYEGNLTQEILNNTVIQNGATYVQVHPTFLYESVWNIALFVILMLMIKRKKSNGSVFALYSIGYGIGRFWIEALRTDQLLLWGTGIPVSQIVSVLFIVFGVFMLFYLKKKRLKMIEETEKNIEYRNRINSLVPENNNKEEDK
ncbi:MAG: prolipoprotein diacylglyceryl transferase [Lachnospiraceae bacterium]|nr:prolipoprotein diacylglyceryl transferase [Lachnospiraceae bacterium]